MRELRIWLLLTTEIVIGCSLVFIAYSINELITIHYETEPSHIEERVVDVSDRLYHSCINLNEMNNILIKNLTFLLNKCETENQLLKGIEWEK